MSEFEANIEKRLFALQDLKYRDFNSKLIPTVPKERVIGVRTPELRRLARELFKLSGVESFMEILPHRYYEEDNLHGFFIEQIKDYGDCVKALDAFLPYVDNWATCDLIRPKVFNRHSSELIDDIKRWLGSSETYTIRFAIEMLMSFFADELFKPEYLKLVAKLRSSEYYVNMMIAWYFATLLAKQYDAALVYIENRALDKWTHNKAIQKALESYRITPAQKEYLRGLKLK